MSLSVSQTTGFAQYLRGGSLPCQRADVRRFRSSGATLALVQHAPTQGIEYPAVDHLIVSVVWRSARAPVVRNVGSGDQRFIDEAGKVLLTPPACASFWRFESEPTVLHLSVPPQQAADWLNIDRDELTENLRRLSMQPHHIPLLSRSVARLWELSARSQRTTLASQQAGFEAEWRRLLSLLLGEANPERSPVSGLSRDRLLPVLAAIEANPEVTLADLSVLAGLSVDHFSRAFRVSTGYTPHQMISHSRIETAKRRLQDSQVSLTDLAIELGFSSSAHFSSRFRQLTGFAPSEWRLRFASNLHGPHS